jgi:hypothetical protein
MICDVEGVNILTVKKMTVDWAHRSFGDPQHIATRFSAGSYAAE